MQTLLAPLRELEEFTQLKIAVEKQNTPVSVVGGTDTEKCHLMDVLQEINDSQLIFT